MTVRRIFKLLTRLFNASPLEPRTPREEGWLNYTKPNPYPPRTAAHAEYQAGAESGFKDATW